MSSDGDPLVVAADLAHQLADSAVWFDGRCNWMGALAGDESLPIGSRRIDAALGPALYDGTSGVALFLAEAAAHFDDARLRTTALGALRHAFDHADRLGPEVRDGLYAGPIGIAYSGARIARQIDSEAALEGARELLRAWRRSPAGGPAADVTSGCAGAVAGLVALTELLDEPWILDAAKEMGEILIVEASVSAAGWSWPDPGEAANHALCGFSHGAAGIGHALFELFDATRDERFRQAGERAFDYELSWFGHRSGTWPDLRGVARAAGWDAPAPTSGSWCHGAPGIALSRLRAEQLGSPGAVRRDADAGLALASALASELLSRAPDDFSLCHGAAGVADVLLYAADTRRDRAQELSGLAYDIGVLGVERHHRPGTGFPSGLPHGQTPSLFLGLAGIGLFYLRLDDRGVGTPLIIHRRPTLDNDEAPSIESKADPEVR
jgi:lantibiotic modifying enzyme